MSMEIESATSSLYTSLSTGKRINSAKDDPAGLAIAETMKAQESGYSKATENAQAGKDLLNIADSALSGVADYLQRMRELAISASNATVSYDEKEMMQKEVDQLKQGITDLAVNTEYNTIKVLDGNMADLHLATNPDGTGQKIQAYNGTLANLGIEDFDLTKDFNIEDIDNALKKVNEQRSDIGAKTNGLEYTISANKNAEYQTTSSLSRTEDEDMAKAISELKKNQTLEQYRIFTQKSQMQQKSNFAALLKAE